jgi:hypothetical protein
LNQEREEQDNVRSQDDEEDVSKPFATVTLDLDGSDGGSRNLKWIEFFHSFACPANSDALATDGRYNTVTAD